MGREYIGVNISCDMLCVCVCVCVCDCSGHGLSGLALLSLASFVAVPAMFAGGISLAMARTLLL